MVRLLLATTITLILTAVPVEPTKTATPWSPTHPGLDARSAAVAATDDAAADEQHARGHDRSHQD
jgi:hypothetical protein